MIPAIQKLEQLLKENGIKIDLVGEVTKAEHGILIYKPLIIASYAQPETPQIVPTPVKALPKKGKTFVKGDLRS